MRKKEKLQANAELLQTFLENTEQEQESLEKLIARLRFYPKEGRVWLDSERALVMEAAVFAAFRQELIAILGVEEARTIISRIGYMTGNRQALQASEKRGPFSYEEAFFLGPKLFSLSGFGVVESLQMEVDVGKGHFYFDGILHDSIEADAHIKEGLAPNSACWLSEGYASGYVTTLLGQPVIFQEVACRAKGDKHCRIVGKPVSQWPAMKPTKLQTIVPDARQFTLTQTFDISAEAELVGVSAGFVATVALVKKVAPTKATAIFLGETGVGKELFAKLLHALSSRKDKPFVAVNCAALPENLIESELFGVERGAFTGATHPRPGRFERAQGGTLFLDEIGELPLHLQGKLLRVLQDSEVERLGDTRARKVDVRLVAATNQDLAKAVKEGRFREDLFYRLHVFPVYIPPLRERKDDIPMLVHYFLQKYGQMHGKNITGLTERAIEALLHYDYPGNVRELEHLIERAVILCDDAVDIGHLFSAQDAPTHEVYTIHQGNGTILPRHVQTPALLQEIFQQKIPLEEVEATLLKMAVEEAKGNLAKAARLLGISRAQLAYRLKRLHEPLDKDREDSAFMTGG